MVASDGIQNLVRNNKLNIVDHLGYTLLHWSALKGRFNWKYKNFQEFNELFRPLITVGRNGIVELLIKNGANLNIKDNAQKTAIQKATENSNLWFW